MEIGNRGDRMSSTVAFRSPDAGFDEPVEMWLACHERVRRFTGLLPRLAEHVDRHGADDEAQATASSIRRYFNEAAPRHHEDEEVDLFPLLRERCHDEPATIAALDRVEADHLVMAGLWRELDAVLARVAAGETTTPKNDAVTRFGAMYDEHIRVEETVLLPALQRVVTAAEWQAIGRAMGERRGVGLPGTSLRSS
jgi:hemerythrin-like domain-containing protein